MLRCSLAVLGMLALALPAEAQVTDVATSSADLFGTVGMIACEQRSGDRTHRAWGTGAIVGSRNTVLTVAHIFVRQPRRGLPRVEFVPETDCAFRLYDAEGQVVFDTGFRQAEFGAFLTNPGLPNQDWAVLRTHERLPQTIDPLPFAAAGEDVFYSRSEVPIEVLAFHADRRSGPRIPLLSKGALFEVDYAGFKRLAHTADTDRMSSGAPVVHRTTEGLGVVLGIHRSEAEYGDFRLTVPLSPELLQALSAYAHGQILLPPARQRLAGDRVAPVPGAPPVSRPVPAQAGQRQPLSAAGEAAILAATGSVSR